MAFERVRVFYRQALFDAALGEDVIVHERTVDAPISWLRGTLVDAGLNLGSISSVYGVGYRFVVPEAHEPLNELPGFLEPVDS